MKFERFYLVDHRGPNNRIILKLVHVENGKSIKVNTATVVKILQYGEIKIQTKFATQKFVSRYSKHNYRNLRNVKSGDPINIYHIPVSLSEDKSHYLMEFYQKKEA